MNAERGARSVRRSHGFLEGVGRLRLHYRTWEVTRARAALLVVHGLSDHSGRYAEFAETMANHRYSTFALDLRGHGGSEGRRGHVRRFGCFLQDLDRFRREVRALTGGACPLVLLGHSLGGLITLRYLQEYAPPVHGAALSSPWLRATPSVSRWKEVLGTVFNRVLPTLPFPAGIDAGDLSHDRRIVSAYRDDSHVHGRITPRLYHEVLEAVREAVRSRDRLTVPLLFLLAGADRLVDTGRSVDFAESLDRADVGVQVYPGYFHEIFNETDPEPVLRDLRAWLDARLE